MALFFTFATVFPTNLEVNYAPKNLQNYIQNVLKLGFETVNPKNKTNAIAGCMYGYSHMDLRGLMSITWIIC